MLVKGPPAPVVFTVTAALNSAGVVVSRCPLLQKLLTGKHPGFHYSCSDSSLLTVAPSGLLSAFLFILSNIIQKQSVNVVPSLEANEGKQLYEVDFLNGKKLYKTPTNYYYDIYST